MRDFYFEASIIPYIHCIVRAFYFEASIIPYIHYIVRAFYFEALIIPFVTLHSEGLLHVLHSNSLGPVHREELGHLSQTVYGAKGRASMHKDRGRSG